MNKQELTRKLADKVNISQKEAAEFINTFTETISSALQHNERLSLMGFGSFTVRNRRERKGRNPKTGETITIPARKVAKFNPSKELLERMN